MLLAGLLWGCACSVVEPKPEAQWDKVIETWSTDPSAALAALQELPTQAEQLIVLDKLLDKDAAAVVALCENLAEGPARNRCFQVKKRRHLWDGAPTDEDQKQEYLAELEKEQTVERTAVGPATFLLDPKTESTWWPLTGAPAISCQEPSQNMTCVFNEAMYRVDQEKAQEAATICGLLAPGSIWRAECMFAAAELSVNLQGRLGYRDATEFCLLGERFSERCLLHVIRILASDAPSADSLTQERWAELVETVQVVSDTWKDKNAQFLDFEMDRFWSAALFVSYREVESVTGDLLDVVPARWHRHVRAAAAWRLLELEGVQVRTLDGWAIRLEEALAARSAEDKSDEPSRASSSRESTRAWDPDIIWIRDKREDGTIPATFYLGRSRRPFSENPLSDSAICILESAVRQQYDMTALLKDGFVHPEPLVQWAAKHLALHGNKVIRRPAVGCGANQNCNPNSTRGKRGKAPR